MAPPPAKGEAGEGVRILDRKHYPTLTLPLAGEVNKIFNQIPELKRKL
jgi:hypothetical protein